MSDEPINDPDLRKAIRQALRNTERKSEAERRTLIQQAGDIGELLELKALALLQRHLVQEATIAAYQDCFMVVTALCVVVMPLVLFLRRPPAE